MKPKLLALLGLIVVVIVAAAVAINLGGSGGGGPEIGQKLYPALADRINDVRSVTIAHAGTAVSLSERDGRWVATDKGGYPVDFTRLRRLLVDLSQLTTLEAKTRLSESYAALEVEDLSPDAKSTLVTLKDASGGALASLLVGKARFGRGTGVGGEGTYVRKAGEAQSWLASGRLAIEQNATGWLERQIINVPRARVERTTLFQPGGVKLTVERKASSDKDFTLLELPEGRKPKNSWDVNDIGAFLENLELEDVRPATELDFPADGPHAEVTTFDGLVVKVPYAEKDGQTWFRFEPSFVAPAKALAKEEAEAAQLKPTEEAEKEASESATRLKGWAYRLTTFKAAIVKKKLDDLLAPPEPPAKADAPAPMSTPVPMPGPVPMPAPPVAATPPAESSPPAATSPADAQPPAKP